MQNNPVFKHWLENASPEDAQKLVVLAQEEDLAYDSFYKELEFGTGGLRGLLGLGPNRMNEYTVGKATQGLSNYLNKHFSKPSVAIARDSRAKGAEFVETAARVLVGNGVHALVFPEIQPTPVLSYAVRSLDCSAGICITASHNPAQYNGYKVYNQDGCQITTEAAKEIQKEIDAIDAFADVTMAEEGSLDCSSLYSPIPPALLRNYENAVLKQSIDPCGDTKIKIVYTPLNGTGLKPMTGIFSRIGNVDLSIVSEQKNPDGNFPTCPKPNPEEAEALALGIQLAEKKQADLLLATDPDADRCGIAVLHNNKFHLLTGNEVGILLTDFIARFAIDEKGGKKKPVVLSTIVSSAMIDKLAMKYDFEVIRVLTGFKFIGEQIGILEKRNEENRFMLGFEESYGYLRGSYVRDKDAIVAGMLICQMTRFWKSQGKTLVDVLSDLYEEYGFFENALIGVEHPGASGSKKIDSLMKLFRSGEIDSIAGLRIDKTIDYLKDVEISHFNCLPRENPHDILPKSNVIQFELEQSCRVIFRPSGTEPKIKAYLFANARSRGESHALILKLKDGVRQLLS